MSILEVNNVSKSFGGVKANVDISMNVEKGKIVGLIGPNGSGKTTLFNSIVGTYPIDNGTIKFNGKEVTELPVPVIGATVFHIFKEGFWTFFLGWQYVALGVLIVVIVIYFPEGIMGWLREKYPERFGEVVDEADRKAQVELK